MKKAVKAKEAEPEVLAVLKTALALNEEEKSLKKQVKAESTQLHLKTKETIEELSDEQVLLLLEQKWIAPLVEQLYALPQAAVDDLVKKVSALAQKYAATLTDLDAGNRPDGAGILRHAGAARGQRLRHGRSGRAQEAAGGCVR